MKNLILIIGWGIGIFTVDYKKDSAVKEVNEAKIAKYQDSLAVIRNSRINKTVATPEPCEKTPCDSNGYFSKGIVEGLKRCPVHKDNPCICDTCPTHKLEVLEVGYSKNKALWKVIAKCGTDCTEVVEIGVRPYKGK